MSDRKTSVISSRSSKGYTVRDSRRSTLVSESQSDRSQQLSEDAPSEKSQEAEEETHKGKKVDVEEYFREHLHKHTDVLKANKEDELETGRGRFKASFLKHLKVFLTVFSRKLFLRHRRIMTTLVEVFLSPLIILFVLMAFTIGVSWDKAYHERRIYGNAQLRFPETEVESLKSYFRTRFCDPSGRILLFFYPDTTLVRSILREVMDEFDIEQYNQFHDDPDTGCEGAQASCEKLGLIAVHSEQEILESALIHRKDYRKHKEPIGVIFEYEGWKKDKGKTPIIPQVLKYRIRMFNEDISKTDEPFPYVPAARTSTKVSPYVEAGFLGLQYAIEEGFLELTDDAIEKELVEGPGAGNIENVAGLNVQKLLNDLKDPKKNVRFPRKDDLTTWPLRIFKMYHYPIFFDPTLRKLMTHIICVTFIISYAFFTYFIVKQVVTENEAGIKDLLKMHNMPIPLHWVILAIHTLLLRGITAILITFILFANFDNGTIMTRSSYSLVFLFLFFHMISLSSFNFFLSTLFDSVFWSGFYAIALGILQYLIPLSFQSLGLVHKIGNIATCFFFPNWGFANGMTQIIEQEVEDKAMDFDRIFELPNPNFTSVFVAFLSFAVNTIFYFGIAVVRDITKQKRLSPSAYKWYQFRKLLKLKRLKKRDHEEFVRDLGSHLNNENFGKPDVYEAERPGENKCLVHLRHVFVSHGKNNIILDTLSMNIYHGEITILLGHTGSGKSSLIQVIAGMLTPTHGYATILGKDINFDNKNAGKHIGYTPQKVILFNILTVEEHLITCYRLRGMGRTTAKKHAASLLTLMKLKEVAERLPTELNDMSKRKLSIAMALVDAPKVILLDEPTNGLESIARREIWTMLESLKNHHTIIIGTNRMDEAEYLGDRVALISHGKLVCYGTPSYLKKQYDTGYFLKIKPEENFHHEATCELIKTHLDVYPTQYTPDEMYSDVKNEVRLEIPKNKIPWFPKLFEDLEGLQEKLGIKSYSLVQISIYDIFIKICDSISLGDEPPDKSFRRNFPDNRRNAFDGMSLPPELQISQEKFKPSCLNSACALVKKRLGYMKQIPMLEFILPVVVIFIVTYHARIFNTKLPDTTAKELSLDSYPEAEIFYRLGTLGNTKSVLSRNYGAKIKEILKDKGVMLLNTQQMLTQFENKTSFIDGYAREKHLMGLEFRLFMRMEKSSGGDKGRGQNVERHYFQFVGYYSSSSLHSPPLIMNLISNVMLSAMFPEENSTRKIIVINEPFPTNFTSPVVQHCDTTCLLFSIIASLAISCFAGGLIIFPKYERNTGMKYLQLMTGLHPALYWGTQYICDFFVAFIFGAIASILLAIDWISNPLESFTSLDQALPMTSLGAPMIVYLTWSAIPFAYFLSAILPGHSNGYGTYIILHGAFGWVPLLLMEIDSVGDKEPSSALVFGRNFFHIFPMYTISTALHRWFEVDASRSLCETVPKKVSEVCDITESHPKHDVNHRLHLYEYIISEDNQFAQCCPRVCEAGVLGNQSKCFQPPVYLDWSKEDSQKPLLLYCIIAFAVQGFFYWGLLIFMERKILTNIVHNAVLKFIKAHSKVSSETRPLEVEEEKLTCEACLAEKTLPEDMALVCYNLKKSYASVMVVNDVSVAVRKGESIAVLGGGGSGKTTFLRLLSGQVLATTGEVFIGDTSIHHHRVKFLKNIGYCPAENFCLFETFTPRQMLELMGRLRGIPSKHLRTHVDQWLNTLGLQGLENVKCKHLTGGLKRCVCVAMSLIGGCEIILMDEPTSGIDPAARQKIWAVMKMIVKNGRTLIFSSYNCEECTYLGSRMVVFSEGNVQCLGNPMPLIDRFARGYTILIRVRLDILTPIEITSVTMGRVVKLKYSMKRKFKHLTLRDEQDNLLLYFLRDLKITWADIFRRLEDVREENEDIIEKYYVSEATIEDVFVLLTNKYRQIDVPRRMSPPVLGEITKKEAEKEAIKSAMKAAMKHTSATHLEA